MSTKFSKILNFLAQSTEGVFRDAVESFRDHYSEKGYLTEGQMRYLRDILRHELRKLQLQMDFEQDLAAFVGTEEAQMSLKLVRKAS